MIHTLIIPMFVMPMPEYVQGHIRPQTVNQANKRICQDAHPTKLQCNLSNSAEVVHSKNFDQPTMWSILHTPFKLYLL